MSEQTTNRQSLVVLQSGRKQHWMREQGNPDSRLIYRGELAEVER